MLLRCVSENRFGGLFCACHCVFAAGNLSNDDSAVDEEKQLLRNQFGALEAGSTSKALEVIRYEGFVVGGHTMNWIAVISEFGGRIDTGAAVKVFAFDPVPYHVETGEQA